MRKIALPFWLLALTVTSQGAAIVPRTLENGTLGVYKGYKCAAGTVGKPNAVIDCLSVLAGMRGESAQPRNYLYQLWQDGPQGCVVTATKSGSHAVIIVPEVPAELVFLLFRCFQSDRSVPSTSAIIEVGGSLGYIVRLVPPTPSAQGQFVNDSTSLSPTFGDSSDAVAGAETTKGALQSRAPVKCASKSPRPAGAFTDCLAAMLKIVNEPGSRIPMSWDSPSDTRDWHADNCVITISPNTYPRGGKIEDVFTERSLINEIFWIMGKCFAGVEQEEGFDWGEMSVGLLRRWKVTVSWGTPSRRIWVVPVKNSTVATADNTQ